MQYDKSHIVYNPLMNISLHSIRTPAYMCMCMRSAHLCRAPKLSPVVGRGYSWMSDHLGIARVVSRASIRTHVRYK